MNTEETEAQEIPEEPPEAQEVSEEPAASIVQPPPEIPEPTSAEAEVKAVLWDLKFKPTPRKSSLSKKEKARRKKARRVSATSRKRH